MPWSYPDNIPNAMKFLKSSIQKKAIRIANHVLKSSGDEGMAVATGIKRAKNMHIKSFKKLASLNWASDAAENQSNVIQQTQAMNASTMGPKLSKMQQPKSFKANFSHVGKISAF